VTVLYIQIEKVYLSIVYKRVFGVFILYWSVSPVTVFRPSFSMMTSQQ